MGVYRNGLHLPDINPRFATHRRNTYVKSPRRKSSKAAHFMNRLYPLNRLPLFMIQSSPFQAKMNQREQRKSLPSNPLHNSDLIHQPESRLLLDSPRQHYDKPSPPRATYVKSPRRKSSNAFSYNNQIAIAQPSAATKGKRRCPKG